LDPDDGPEGLNAQPPDDLGGQPPESITRAMEMTEGDPLMPASEVAQLPSDAFADSEDGDAGDKEQSLGTSATRGFLWANLGIFTRYGAALILAALLARSLDSAEYSAMAIMTVVLLYFDTALDLGMGAALVYEQESGITKRVRVAFSANVAFAMILAAVAVVAAPLLTSFFSLEEFTSEFRAIGAVILVSGFATVPWALFLREMQFRQRAFTEVARDLTRFGVTVVLVMAGWGLWGVVIGFLAAKVVWLVGTWWALRFKPQWEWDRSIVKDLFGYSWKMAGTRFLGLLALNGDYFVVGNRAPKEVGLYYQAFRLPEFIMAGQLNAMSAVLFPMYARVRTDGMPALRAAMYKALGVVSLFSIPVGIALAVLSRDAFSVMFGHTDPTGVMTMQIISLTGCVVGLGFATGDLLFATGRPDVMLKLNLVMVPIMLGTMYVVGPQGIVWIAVVHFVNASVFTGIRQVIVNRLTESPMTKAVASVTPGLVVGICVAVVALPVRLATSGGFSSLLLVGLAVAAGGLLGLAISRQARTELGDLVAKLRGR
jgi:PST family polysaccharide transporter